MNARHFTIAGFAALLAALAANGSAAFEALAGLPVVLQTFSATMPLGLVSALMTQVICMLAWYHLNRRGARLHSLDADLIALLLGVMLAMAQTLVGWPKTAGDILQSLLVGILTGLAAPILAKLVMALLRTESKE